MGIAIWKKLNLKNEKQIGILNAPLSFETEIGSLSNVQINRDLDRLDGLSFLVAFVTELKEIEGISSFLSTLADGDVTVWFCYPKGSSKKYTSNVNRDTGWEPMGTAGFEGVRQVAIDEDWSAIRFRRVGYIKKMQRHPKRALSEKGKAKTKKL